MISGCTCASSLRRIWFRAGWVEKRSRSICRQNFFGRKQNDARTDEEREQNEKPYRMSGRHVAYEEFIVSEGDTLSETVR